MPTGRGQASVTTDVALSVTETLPQGPPGTPPPAPEGLVDVRLGLLVAAFLALAALDHLVVALPQVHRVDERLLSRSRNPFRWAEYSLSSTLTSCSSPTSPASRT